MGAKVFDELDRTGEKSRVRVFLVLCLQRLLNGRCRLFLLQIIRGENLPELQMSILRASDQEVRRSDQQMSQDIPMHVRTFVIFTRRKRQGVQIVQTTGTTGRRRHFLFSVVTRNERREFFDQFFRLFGTNFLRTARWGVAGTNILRAVRTSTIFFIMLIFRHLLLAMIKRTSFSSLQREKDKSVVLPLVEILLQ